MPNHRQSKIQLNCLSAVFAIFFLSAFLLGVLVVEDLRQSSGSSKFLSWNDDLTHSSKTLLRGYNLSKFFKGRQLGPEHNSMIWGSIRSVQYWEDAMETAGEDDTGEPGSKSFEQYAQQAYQEECYSGFRMEMQAAAFTGKCYHRPTSGTDTSPVDRFTILDQVNLLNPGQYGPYKTPAEEIAVLKTRTDDGAAARLAYYEFAQAENYCIKCCDESTMLLDEEEGLLATTWDLLCEDIEGGQIQVTKDLHSYEKGYEFIMVDFKNTGLGDPLDPTTEEGNFNFIKCSPDLLSLSDYDKTRSMQGYHLKLWVEYDNHFVQQLKSVVKCSVEPIWEVQLEGKPCTQNDQIGCLYNEKITMYRVKKITVATWLIWLPISLMVCGYCMSCFLGYAGGWCFHWCDQSSGVHWCSKIPGVHSMQWNGDDGDHDDKTPIDEDDFVFTKGKSKYALMSLEELFGPLGKPKKKRKQHDGDDDNCAFHLSKLRKHIKDKPIEEVLNIKSGQVVDPQVFGWLFAEKHVLYAYKEKQVFEFVDYIEDDKTIDQIIDLDTDEIIDEKVWKKWTELTPQLIKDLFADKRERQLQAKGEEIGQKYAKKYKGYPPIVAAATEENWEAVLTLIDCGADVTVTGGRDKRTALHWISQDKDFEDHNIAVSTRLLDAEDRVNVEFQTFVSVLDYQDDIGRTPLMLAVEQSNIGLVELYLKREANHLLKDDDNWTALMYANEAVHRQKEKKKKERNKDAFAVLKFLKKYHKKHSRGCFGCCRKNACCCCCKGCLCCCKREFDPNHWERLRRGKANIALRKQMKRADAERAIAHLL
jgi:hypothetical protein